MLEAEAVPVEAPEAEVAAARVAGRVEARAVGLEPEVEVEAEQVEPEERLVEELAARAAPAEQVEPGEPGEPGEQVVARVGLAAEAEERAGQEEATTTTRTRMR